MAHELVVLGVVSDDKVGTLVRRGLAKFIQDFQKYEDVKMDQEEEERLAREKQKQAAEEVLRRIARQENMSKPVSSPSIHAIWEV